MFILIEHIVANGSRFSTAVEHTFNGRDIAHPVEDITLTEEALGSTYEVD